MGDYEELVELGFEGVDRFATHFHDPVFGYVSAHKPFAPKSKGKRGGEAGPKTKRGEEPPAVEQPRKLPKGEEVPPRKDSPQLSQYDPERDLPPHPQWNLPPPPLGAVPVAAAPPGSIPVGVAPLPGQLPVGIPPPPPGLPVGYPPVGQQPSVQLPPPPSGQPPRNPLPRQRSYSESRGGRYDNRSIPDSRYASDSDFDDGRAPRSMYPPYAPDRRRDGDRRYDNGYERTVEEWECWRPSGTPYQQMAVRSRDANRYQGAIVPRAPSPPTDIGYSPRGYQDDWDGDQRPTPRRQRSSSWSPPRKSDRGRDSQSRRRRSKSPKHHQALATVVGALVGGAAGSRVKKGESGVHTMATVGGAIIGGIAGRELEQQYDRYKERRERRDYSRGEGRERRRAEREYN